MHPIHIRDKMRDGQLRWLGHVQYRLLNLPLRKCDKLVVEGVRKEMRRPKMTIRDTSIERFTIFCIDAELVSSIGE